MSDAAERSDAGSHTSAPLCSVCGGEGRRYAGQYDGDGWLCKACNGTGETPDAGSHRQEEESQ